MKQSELKKAVQRVKEETRIALQTLFDELNHGQQQKVLKNEDVKTLFERYGVKY